MAAKFTKPYVDALFDVAGGADAVDALLSPLAEFARTLDGSDELRRVLKSPSVDRARKRALVEAIARQQALPELATRFLGVLLGNRRLFHLNEVLAGLRGRLDRDRREVEASLTTAVPMSEERTAEIVRLLSNKTKQMVRVRSAVDPALLGGFVVRVGSEIYDASLAQRLKKARQALHHRS